ncbi:cathepsin L-like proteinase isoform X2 [Thrips palmi]|uniref:Cathepsin L-like proteinase isoform X2 n=1 Tax=Thrips palmi TaxID=161013 RepID=A0A6P8ZXV7_THRPL|nr:cathepsin L-like proteinase isoform X2 [Thrips palmi]
MPETKDTPPDYSKTPIDQLWADWKAEHSKTYETKEEEERRLGIFKKTLEVIANANARYVSGESTYYCGLNQFADLVRKGIPRGVLRWRSIA